MCSPLDLTKVRLQASGDKRMIESMKKTVRTAGASLSSGELRYIYSLFLRRTRSLQWYFAALVVASLNDRISGLSTSGDTLESEPKLPSTPLPNSPGATMNATISSKPMDGIPSRNVFTIGV